MHIRSVLMGLAAAVVLSLCTTPFAGANPISDAAIETEAANVALSTYWSWKIHRWESLIVESAELRQLDPDFLASLVWMESRGDPYAVGPVGAVGLMQVMPKEAGFNWRPSKDALMDPATNLFWGSRTLATVINQGQGDVFNALAAYNGGWDQVMYRGPTIFATTILRDYAHAVALRYGLEQPWVAFFARQDFQIRGPIWIADSERSDVYFFGRQNLVPEGMHLIPDIPPASTVARGHDEQLGGSFIVGIWLYDIAHQEWIYTPGQEANHYVIDPPNIAKDEGAANPAAPAVTKVDVQPPAPPAPAEDPPPQPEFVCPGGDFRVDAWPLHAVVNERGWTATIYAEGFGGDCHYTYAWNIKEDVKAVVIGGAITFDITTPRRDADIVGTVIVTSAGETKRVQLYIPSPKK
ncbi:MAG: transglycosylase SLT domain-containing protein [Anaerolineae bacterium]|nr:transglycosylase SLT domain-containing protein [Anaerolineae bacterium]